MPRDVNQQRLCTVPSIFGFREWFERGYGNLCEVHDKVYEDGGCTFCADLKFGWGMIKTDWKYNKARLLFSVPIQPVMHLAFTGFKIYKWGLKK